MKNSLLQNLPSFQNKGQSSQSNLNLKNSKPSAQKAPDNTQARIQAMQNTQRASGRRGN